MIPFDIYPSAWIVTIILVIMSIVSIYIGRKDILDGNIVPILLLGVIAIMTIGCCAVIIFSDSVDEQITVCSHLYTDRVNQILDSNMVVYNVYDTNSLIYVKDGDTITITRLTGAYEAVNSFFGNYPGIYKIKTSHVIKCNGVAQNCTAIGR